MNKILILKGTFIIILCSIVSKSMSFLVETLIAHKYGACQDTDIFYLVEGVIFSITPMLSVGIFKVFIPEYRRLCLKHYIYEAERLTSNLMIVFILISICFFFVFMLFSSRIIYLFAPGFNLESNIHASYLLRILSPILIFGPLSTIPSSILQSKSLFYKSQMKEIVYFIFPLFFLLCISNDSSIDSLAVSVTVGYIFTCVFQYILLNPYIKYRFKAVFWDRITVKILKAYPIACINALILQLNNIIDRIFSSTLTVGSVTYLNYGCKVINVFEGLFLSSINLAMFPHLTELISQKSKEEVRSFLTRYFSILIAILVPISSLLFISSHDIILILFGHGQFNSESVNVTSDVLKMYTIGFIAMGLTTVTNDIFYIKNKVKPLLYTTILNICSNIILDFIFIKYLGVSGLCLATAISLYITLMAKWYYMRQYILPNRSFWKNCLTILFAVLLVSPILYLINKTLLITYAAFVRLLLGGIVYFLSYAIILLGISTFYRKQLIILICKNK